MPPEDEAGVGGQRWHPERGLLTGSAIQKALMDLQEVATREAYAKQPDGPAAFDPSTWGEWKPRTSVRARSA